MIYVSKVRMWLAEGAPCIHLILLLQCWGLLIEIYGISPSFQDQVKMRQKDCHFGTGCIETFFLTCLIRGRSSIFLRRGAPLWNDFNLISCFFFGRILLIIESHRSSGGGGCTPCTPPVNLTLLIVPSTPPTPEHEVMFSKVTCLLKCCL